MIDKVLNLFTDIRYFFYYSFDIFLLLLAFFIKIFSFDTYKIKANHKNKKKSIIVCNGPSLSKDISWISNNQSNFEISVVNYFANTSYFPAIKPRFYFLTDPMFWRSNITNNVYKDNDELFKNLKKVDWEMTIICPDKGYVDIRKKICNSFIKVEKLRHFSLDFKSRLVSIFSISLNLSTPLFATVAVMALWYLITKNKKEIYLYGIDYSFFKEYTVDQKTNEIFNPNSHFYKNTASQNYNPKYKNKSKKLINAIMYKNWLAFEQMYLLSQVAKKKKIKIFNSSSNSYIDCFDRKNLKEN